MPRLELQLSNLRELDPRLDIAASEELKTLVRDIQDRPGVTAARKLPLELSLTPVAPRGVVDAVKVGVKIGSRLPAKQSPEYETAPHGSGALMSNPASPYPGIMMFRGRPYLTKAEASR